MLIKGGETENGHVRVTFQFPSEIWAETVHLVGDFNQWDRHSLPLTRTRHGDDNWTITLELEKGQSYQFRYLVNNQTWVNDCNADDYAEPLWGLELGRAHLSFGMSEGSPDRGRANLRSKRTSQWTNKLRPYMQVGQG